MTGDVFIPRGVDVPALDPDKKCVRVSRSPASGHPSSRHPSARAAAFLTRRRRIGSVSSLRAVVGPPPVVPHAQWRRPTPPMTNEEVY